jgi:hypothetical protein
MNKKVDKFVPVLFQKLKTFEDETQTDTRFLKVKIWLCHTGENFNGSFFDKGVVEDAIPSLANTPILAYIEENSDGEKDFSDHRMVLVKEDDKYKVKYIGQAIGVIPEENNAQFEMRLCDDGIEREFLTVEGLVWTKWDDPIDIFDRNQFKAQSMELHDDYDGEWKEDNLFHFTSFKFFGACALGEDVLPAMHSSTIEAQFSENNVFNNIQEKFELFKETFSNRNKGGNEKVNEKLELLNKYSLTKEDVQGKGLDIEKYSLEDLETELQKITEPENFALVASQLKDELKAELYKDYTEDDWGYRFRNYWYIDHTDEMIVAEDSLDGDRLVGLSYSVDNDVVSIDFDSKKRVKLAYQFVEGDESTTATFSSADRSEYETKVKEKQIEEKYTQTKEDFAQLEKEVDDLRAFKKDTLDAEKEAKEQELFESFASELTEDELQEVKDAASEYTLEQIEEKLYTALGKKKAKFSKSKKTEKQATVKVGIQQEDNTPLPYGGIFEKYKDK